MRLRDLSKVKNEVVLEIEDIIIDNLEVLEVLTQPTSSDEDRLKASKAITDTLIKKVMENKIDIARICFCDERGNDIPDEVLESTPLKIPLMFKAVPEITQILFKYIEETVGENESEGKPQIQKRPKVKKN